MSQTLSAVYDMSMVDRLETIVCLFNNEAQPQNLVASHGKFASKIDALLLLATHNIKPSNKITATSPCPCFKLPLDTLVINSSSHDQYAGYPETAEQTCQKQD